MQLLPSGSHPLACQRVFWRPLDMRSSYSTGNCYCFKLVLQLHELSNLRNSQVSIAD
ncbi:hypothetical protein RYX36_031429 [Vicia faba]